MKKSILIFLILTLFGCRESLQNSRINIGTLDPTIVITSKMDRNSNFSISLYSFIQANKSGLYITPSATIDESVLYKYPNEELGKCCVGLEEAIRKGRGPHELLKIYSSTRTINGDTLLFYSPNSAKYLSINNKGDIFKPFGASKNIVNTGYSFSYNNGYLLVPSFNKFFSKDFLFTITNVKNGNQRRIFKPRIPAGYEPAIRNQVVAMGPLPGGFAVSFLGDRKLYIIDFEGEIKHQLIFGKSEPIPDPYKITNPKQAPSSKPYIPKIEFYKGHLLVLVDNLIWVLNYPSYESKTLVKILRDPDENSAPVIDFSITENFTYVRMGQDSLYFTHTNPNWFK